MECLKMSRKTKMLKSVKTLPSVSVLRGGKVSKSHKKSRKLTFKYEVDIIDNKHTGLLNEFKPEAAFLDFVESCEDVLESDENASDATNNSKSISFLSKKLMENMVSDSMNKKVLEPEIVVVEPGIVFSDQSSDEFSSNDNIDNLTPEEMSDIFGKEENTVEQEPIFVKEKFVLLQSGLKTIIVLSHPVEICFKGLARIKALSGSCEILSYVITDTDSKYYNVLSPNTNSYLTIKTKVGKSQNKIEECFERDLFKEMNIKELIRSVSSQLQGECVVLLCDTLTCSLYDYMLTIPQYKNLFKTEEEQMKYSFSMLQNTDSLVVSSSQQTEMAKSHWKKLIEDVGCPIVMVVGGKNCGKSTLNRMLINSTLNIMDSVNFLDCDVGQAEFTPSGFVSLHEIREPVLGPPFTHQQDSSTMCFYGEITPSRNLSRYIKSVEYILKCYRDQEIKKPLIVNTLGWNEGLGVHIIVDLIHMIQPSIIIQLRCEYNYNNFPILTNEFLSHSPGWLYNTDRSLTIQSDHLQEQNLLVIDSDVPTKHKTDFKAAQMRELSLLAYLNRNLKIGQKLLHVEPYVIDFNHVAVHDCQNRGSYSQILYALNASVVGLCEANLTKVDERLENGLGLYKETPICNCVGLGIVRGIDIKNKLLYMVCPIPQEKLLNVNLLVKGAIQLPDTLYLEQSEEILELPYRGYLPKSLGSKALVVRNKMPRKQYLNNKI